MFEKIPTAASQKEARDILSAQDLIQMMKRDFAHIPSVNDIPDSGTLTELLKGIMEWRLSVSPYAPEVKAMVTEQFLEKEAVTWEDYDAISDSLEQKLKKE